MDVSRFYEAAQRAGFLKECRWSPVGGQPDTRFVNFDAGGQRRFDGVAITTDALIKFPSHWFPNIRKGDGIEVGGKNYVAAEIMLVGDGSEKEVTLRKAP